MALADDVVLIAKTKRALQNDLDIYIITEMGKRGMEINLNKTKTMIILRENSQHQIRSKEKTLGQVGRKIQIPSNDHK